MASQPGESEAAQSVLAEAAALDRECPIKHLNWGRTYAPGEEANQPVGVWRKATDAQGIAACVFLQGQAAAEQGFTRIARGYYASAIEIAPHLAMQYYALDDLCWQQKRRSEAIGYCALGLARERESSRSPYHGGSFDSTAMGQKRQWPHYCRPFSLRQAILSLDGGQRRCFSTAR